MTNDTRPPVAPVEGHYGELRCGSIVGPLKWRDDMNCFSVAGFSTRASFWEKSGIGGECGWRDGEEQVRPDLDIIAIISPEAMALAAGLVEPTTIVETGPPQSTWLSFDMAKFISAADAACDYADQHCRAFPIATAPRERWIEFWDTSAKTWRAMWLSPYVEIDTDYYTHWRETAPPPTNPPLPTVFVELGAALEKIKGA